MISVCVPYWNRQDALDGMVEHYGVLYPDLDIEISVCDDGSSPPAHIPPRARHHLIRITRLPAKDHPLNPCVPINRAVDKSSGDIIVLTNPEVRHDGPVLHEMLALLQDEMDYVTARCYGVGYGKAPIWLAGPEVDYTTRGRLPVPDGAHFHFLAMLHRSLWDKAGGFDEDYRHVQAADDNDWLWRLDSVGARFKTTDGACWQPKSDITTWNLPHGADTFRSKWPGVA